MTRRTDQLPMGATFVVWASRSEEGGLTAGEKILCYHTWVMDRSFADGCYMSGEAMARRIGFKSRSVEQLRYRLKKLGLLESWERPGSDKPGWCLVLPEHCVPKSARPAGPEAEALAQELDRYLVSQDPSRCPEGRPPPGNGHCKTTATAIASPKQQPLQKSRRAKAAALEGGQGGGSLQSQASQLSETQLLPAVRQRRVAKATRKTTEANAPNSDQPKLPLMAVETGRKKGLEPIGDYVRKVASNLMPKAAAG